MSKKKWLLRLLFYPVFITLLMWMVFLIEFIFSLNFTEYGIQPRTQSGLRGVLFSPFIHSGLSHITNNTTSFFVLMLLLRIFYVKNYLRIFILSLLLSGFLTWCFARPAYHIGMSGVIYALASFIFTKGFFSKNYKLIALSLTIVFIYGSMIWYVFPIDVSISWEGHLAGLLSGIFLSFLFKNEINNSEKKSSDSHTTLFLRHFNDKGKFIANLPFLDEDGNLINQEEE